MSSVAVPEAFLEPEDTDDDIGAEEPNHVDQLEAASPLECISIDPPDLDDFDAPPLMNRVSAMDDYCSKLSSTGDDPPKLRRASEESEMDTDTEIEQLTKGQRRYVYLQFLKANLTIFRRYRSTAGSFSDGGGRRMFAEYVQRK